MLNASWQIPNIKLLYDLIDLTDISVSNRQEINIQRMVGEEEKGLCHLLQCSVSGHVPGKWP